MIDSTMPFYIRDLSICEFWYPLWKPGGGGGQGRADPGTNPSGILRDNRTVCPKQEEHISFENEDPLII